MKTALSVRASAWKSKNFKNILNTKKLLPDSVCLNIGKLFNAVHHAILQHNHRPASIADLYYVVTSSSNAQHLKMVNLEWIEWIRGEKLTSYQHTDCRLTVTVAHIVKQKRINIQSSATTEPWNNFAEDDNDSDDDNEHKLKIQQRNKSVNFVSQRDI